MIVHMESGNHVPPRYIQSENTVRVTICFIIIHSFTFFWETHCHSCHMLLREDDGFNLRSPLLDHGAMVLGRIESHRYISSLVFVDEENAT